jgi:hypothetical protein
MQREKGYVKAFPARLGTSVMMENSCHFNVILILILMDSKLIIETPTNLMAITKCYR